MNTSPYFLKNFSSGQKVLFIVMIKDEQDILSSSGVERSAVNRFVVGSNPTWGDAYYMANL